jgi:hypothetical protein
VIEPILQAVAIKVAALNPTIAAQPVPVVVRKLARRQEGVDPARQLTVCKSPVPEETRRFGGKYDLDTWRVRLSVEAPNNDDQVANLDDYSTLRQQLIDGFKKKPDDLMGLDNLRDVRAVPAEFLDYEKIEQNYDHFAVDVLVSVVRER